MNDKKNNPAVRMLLRILIFLLLMVLTFLLSYFGVSKWYTNRLDKKDAAEKKAEEKTAQVQAEESVKNCSFAMLYLDNPDTEEVDYCALRVFNQMNCEMSVFMIPSDSEVTLSSDLQKELSEKADGSVEQNMKLKDFGACYSDTKTKYEMITKVMQELIGGVSIDSYEALDYDGLIQVVDLADPVTVKVNEMVTYVDEDGETYKLTPGQEHEIDGRRALGILTYTDGFGSGDGGRIERSSDYLMEYVTSITTSYNKTQMSEYLSQYCKLIVTNGTINDASTYVEECLKLNEENLSFYTLKGSQKEDTYLLDSSRIQDDIKILMGEDAFELATTESQAETTTAAEAKSTEAEEEQEEETSLISSKDKTITIYNGAYINGLAGRWRDRLQEDGYQIEGIYNYSGGTRDNGKIIVSEEGMGVDLQKEYFPNAEIEVGVPEEGVDIQIILGRSEDF